MAIFGKKESYLGVDLGANGIKLVELRKTKGRAQLWTYGMISEPLDIHVKYEKSAEELLLDQHSTSIKTQTKKSPEPIAMDDPRIDKYAKMLKELLKATKVSTKRVTASLPVSHVFHSLITLPPVEKKDVIHHIEAKVKKLLPRPIEEMQVVHQQIPQTKEEEKRALKFLVTAAPKDLVTFYTAIFQKAGLQLEELETEAFALERSLVGHDKSTVMVVDIGAERTNFFIIDQGIPVTHRSIHVAGDNIDKSLRKILGLPDDMVKQVKFDMSTMDEKIIPLDIFQSALDPIVKEIEYSFDLYLHQIGNEKKRPEKIILTGGSCVFPPIARYLRETLGMKVFIGDPWARVVYQQGLKHLLDTLGPRMAVSIGLAMRNIHH